eukprot:6614151-Ditylum_brightwellii.AAC.1
MVRIEQKYQCCNMHKWATKWLSFHHEAVHLIKKKVLFVVELKGSNALVSNKIKEVITKYSVMETHSNNKFKDILLPGDDNKDISSIQSSSSCKSDICHTSSKEE